MIIVEGEGEKNKKKIPYVFLISVLVLASFVVRADLIKSHFTYPDSIGVVTTIIRAQSMSDENLLRKFQIQSDDAEQSKLVKGFLGQLIEDGILPPSFLRQFYAAISVPMGWSYGPLQYVVSSFLFDPAMSLESILLVGRSVPVLFFILFILLASLLPARLQVLGKYEASVLVVVLVGFSWPHIINSLMMYNYQLGQLFAVIILHCMVLPKKSWSLTQKITCSLLVCVGCMAHYQLVVFIPGVFLGIIVSATGMPRNLKHLKRSVKFSLPFVISFAAFFIPFFYLFILPKLGNSVSYGRGANGEYLFSELGEGNSNIADYIMFFPKNIFLIVTEAFSVSQVNSAFSMFLSIALFVVFVAGVYAFYSRPKISVQLKIYVSSSIVIYFALVLTGKLVFGPSRHSLVLVPFILLFLILGVELFVKRHALFKVSILSLSALVGGGFIYGYANEKIELENSYVKFINEIEEVLETYQVTHLIDYNNDQNLIYMPEILKNYRVYNNTEHKLRNDYKKGWVGRLDTPAEIGTIALVGSEDVRLEDIQVWLSEMGGMLSSGGVGLEIVYSQTISTSSAKIEYSRNFDIGSNRLNIYILGNTYVRASL